MNDGLLISIAGLVQLCNYKTRTLYKAGSMYGIARRTTYMINK
jgi:hypothetical protein